MSYSKELNTSSGVFFFLGACLYKAQYIPIPYLSFILKTLALVLYFIAYILWGVAFYLHPEKRKPINPLEWLTSERIQHILAATIGIVATILCLLTFANPLIPTIGLCLYVVSNICWCMAEYIKWKAPEYRSSSSQLATLGYATSMTTVSLIVAITAILLLTLPVYPVNLVLISAATCIAIGLIGVYFWTQSLVEDPKIKHVENDIQIAEGYEQITEQLRTNTNTPTPKNKLETQENSDLSRSFTTRTRAKNSDQDTLSGGTSSLNFDRVF